MVPEKKPIELSEENEVLEQTAALTEQTEKGLDNPKEDGNSTILTQTNGMQKENDKKVKPLSVRRFRTVITLFAVVIALVLGTIGVNLMPEKEDESSSAPTSSISVKKALTEDIEKIVVNGSYGKLTFLSKKTEAENSTSSESTATTATYTWALEGYDPSLIASSSVNAAADNLATVYAVRIMETDLSQKELYGLNKPLVTAEVFMREGKGENYTLTVGGASPDGSGYYATVTGDNNIYLISTGTVNNFNKKPEALANSVVIDPPVIDNVSKRTDKKYYDEETGYLASYDSIELSGSKYSTKAVITPIADNDFVECNIDLGNYSRYADPEMVSEMFGLMTNGLVAMDTYVLEPTAAQIKQYGLESPEYLINIKAGSINVTLKATLYDKTNNYYAVTVNGKNAIYSVSADALTMLDLKVEDYFYQFVFQEFIHDFKNITVEAPEKTYSFDIKHDTSNDTITATSNGKKVDDALLSTYYQYYLILSPEVQSSYTDGKVELKATFTPKSNAKAPTVIELVKQSARRFLVRIDGTDLGIVSSQELDPLIVYAEYVMNNKGIPEP